MSQSSVVFSIIDDVYDEKTFRELVRVYPKKRPVPSAALNDVIRRGSRVDVLLKPAFSVRPHHPIDTYSLPLKPWVRALMTFGTSRAQRWHIDDVDSPQVKYLTLIVALDDLHETMPLTEFDFGDGEVVCPCLKKNQGILFDGRLLHRGGGGEVARAPVVYQVFAETTDENVEDDAEVYIPRKRRKFVDAAAQ